MSGDTDKMTKEEWEDFYFTFCEIMGEKPKIKRTFRKSKEELYPKPKPSLWQKFKKLFKKIMFKGS